MCRLRRLEQIDRRARRPHLIVQIGRIKKLPEDYEGERHVVTVSKALDDYGRDRHEWEERPGPGPASDATDANDEQVLRVFIVDGCAPGLRSNGTLPATCDQAE